MAYKMLFANKRVLLVLLTLFVALYLVGVVWARQRAKPFQEALKIVSEAEGPVKSGWSKYNTERDEAKYFELERKYVSLLEKADSKDLSGTGEGDGVLKYFIREKRQLAEEILVYDQKLFAGDIKTAEEGKEYIRKFNERDKSIIERYRTYARIPGWMCFFLVYPPGACWML